MYQQGIARSENKYTWGKPVCCVCVRVYREGLADAQPTAGGDFTEERVGVEKGGVLLFPSVPFE